MDYITSIWSTVNGIDSIFIDACSDGDLETVSNKSTYFLSDQSISDGFLQACKNNRITIIEYLLNNNKKSLLIKTDSIAIKSTDKYTSVNLSIEYAMRCGNVNITNILLTEFISYIDNDVLNEVFEYCCSKNNIIGVNHILQFRKNDIDIRKNYSCIDLAIQSNNNEICRILLNNFEMDIQKIINEYREKMGKLQKIGW